LSLNFSTATQGQLQTAVTAINPGQTLASTSTAQNQLTGTVATSVAGSYSGSYSGGATGTWMLTIDSSGNVSGSFNDSKNGTGPISGAWLTAQRSAVLRAMLHGLEPWIPRSRQPQGKDHISSVAPGTIRGPARTACSRTECFAERRSGASIGQPTFAMWNAVRPEFWFQVTPWWVAITDLWLRGANPLRLRSDRECSRRSHTPPVSEG
jgi:hypothetical protein